MTDERWIVSASRRTDIPAAWSDWLVTRVREGWAWSVNPYNNVATRVSLRPRDVRALVLWSRDLSAFESSAVTLRDAGLPLFFQATVNAFPRSIEPRVPPLDRAMEGPQWVARRFGPGAIDWRYDPVLVGGELDAAWHADHFGRIAALWEGLTTTCVVSFGTMYRKVRRNLARASEPGPRLHRPAPAVIAELLDSFGDIARRRGIDLRACCDPDAEDAGASRALCIDAKRLEALYPGAGRGVPRRSSRPGCGCSASRDIGLYDSCPHGCVYCYANSDPDRARGNCVRYEKRGDGASLFGRVEPGADGTSRWHP